MKSLGNFPASFEAELHEQPDAILASADALVEQTDALRELAAAAAAARTIVLTGMGGSYDACHVPATMLGEAGVPAVLVDAAELLHFRRPILRPPQTLLVAVSQSGESAEVVRLLSPDDGPGPGPVVVSVTNGLSNPVARAAAIAFDTRAGREAGPSTKTFAACLVTLAAVARVLAGEDPARAAGAVAAEATVAAGAARSLLDRADEVRTTTTAWAADRPMVAILGRGTARAAAEMAALLLKESARFPAESLEAGQFRHGPVELAGPDLAAAVVATEPATAEMDHRLAQDLRRAGASVLVVDTASGPAPAAHVAVDAAVSRALVPTVAMVPFQLLAARLADERGRDPLRMQVASKVTAHE